MAGDLPTPPYTEATEAAEALGVWPEPIASELAAAVVTGHRCRCQCRQCWAIRTGFDIGYASGMSSGVASGRAQAAADIRADRGSLDGLVWRERAARIAEGLTERDELTGADVDEPTLLVGTGVPDPRAETEDGGAR